MEIPWAVLAQLGMMGYSALQKGPKKPKLSYQEALSPEEEARYLDAVRRRITERTGESQQALTQGAIGRGFGSSGQIGAIQRRLALAGNRDYATAVTGLEGAKAGRLQQWREMMAGFQHKDYQSELERHYGQQGQVGTNLGTLLASPEFASLFKGKKKDDWSKYI